MATNEYFGDGHDIQLAVPAYCVSGSAVAVGALVGVCQTTRDANGNATVRTRGVHKFACAAGVASAGLALYVTNAGVITTTVGSNTLFGYSVAVKDTAGNVLVKIHQV